MYYNITQSFINLANANMAAFSRLTQSPELANVMKADTDTNVQQTNGVLADATKFEALAEWTKTILNNYASFVNELTQSFFDVLGQRKTFITEQTKELLQNFQYGLDDILYAEEGSVDAMNAEYDAVVLLETARQKRKTS